MPQVLADAETMAVPERGFSQAENDTAAERKFRKGLLWKIQSHQAKVKTETSYLFGTIHSDDERVTNLPEVIRTTFNGSSSYAMEVKMDNADLTAMANAMFFSEDQTLKKLIGPELYQATENAVKAHGLTTEELNKTKPWVIVTMLNMPRPKTGVFLDLKLHLEAAGQRKDIYGLETMEEQIAVFDELPIADQVSLLKETIATSGMMNQQLEQLIQAYLARDLEQLETLSEKLAPENKDVYNRVMDRLLTQRNARMIERMLPIIKEGNAFIAVGAMHLPGKEGLLQLLEDRGYRVTPIY
ncbi:MAG: TraB/GumN family protein [Gammaproteobacteria bacterium]|nr:TraB/GumN family protein [Gammaproteobacteria bacterium]